MTNHVEKTIPSEDILPWLAGIVEGEGSLGTYNQQKSGRKFPRISIVNTDRKIVDRVKEILDYYKIFYSSAKKTRVENCKICYYIAIHRRDDVAKLLNLLIPFMIGGKKDTAKELIQYVEQNPTKVNQYQQVGIYFICKYCGDKFTGRRRIFCSLTCWHRFAKGKNNPNYKTGKYIARND